DRSNRLPFHPAKGRPRSGPAFWDRSPFGPAPPRKEFRWIRNISRKRPAWKSGDCIEVSIPHNRPGTSGIPEIGINPAYLCPVLGVESLRGYPGYPVLGLYEEMSLHFVSAPWPIEEGDRFFPMRYSLFWGEDGIKVTSRVSKTTILFRSIRKRAGP